MNTQQKSPPPGKDLVETMALNLRLSEELLNALNEESRALRAMDTQGLFRLSSQKETLLTKIHYLDDSLRQSLTGQAEGDEAISLEERRVLNQYQQRINITREEIKNRNSINKRFTEDTLNCLGEAISLLTRPEQQNNTYRAPGRPQARGRSLPSCISCEA